MARMKIIEGGRAPERQKENDACLDCYARCGQNILVEPGERTLVPLGFALELRAGWEAQVRPRSGLFSKGIDVAFGTVDSNYRGEVKACVINNSKSDFVVEDGDRICQLSLKEVPSEAIEIAEELSDSERGGDGFGSSGLK